LHGAAVDPLAVVAKRVPRGVFCIQTALYIHGLAPQPEQVWIALGSKDRPPKVGFPPLRLVRLSGAARNEGVEIQILGGTEIRVYGLAKTLADCLKFRNKIGSARPLDLVTRCLDEKRCTLDELRRFAAICRVERVLDAHLLSRGTKK
jgi:predicted transcriptional regulator of viral defense system